MRKAYTTLLILAFIGSPVSAAVFQFCVLMTATRGHSFAYPWVPARAERLRGALVAGMTLAEREPAKDQYIRRACAAEAANLAVIVVEPLVKTAQPVVQTTLIRKSRQTLIPTLSGRCEQTRLNTRPGDSSL